MQSFEALSAQFIERFNTPHFPKEPSTLYEPNDYFLRLGGKRVRPVMVLMGADLFNEISEDAWNVASAVELFHNFTLIHDDIMDKAPLRRGMTTVHEKYGNSTALLAGDVMLVVAYDYLNKVSSPYLRSIIALFNLKADADRDAYEQWARTRDLPDVRSLDSVEAFEVLRTTGLLFSADKPPYDYVEILDISGIDAFMADAGGAKVARLAEEMGAFTDGAVFITTQPL